VKLLGKIALALLAIGIIAGGVVSSLLIREERDAIAEQIGTLQTRVHDLRQCTDYMTAEIERLEGDVAAHSNRADAAENRVIGEKNTNEPLRRQIEEMMEERIDLESKQAATEKQVADAGVKIQGLTTELAAAASKAVQEAKRATTAETLVNTHTGTIANLTVEIASLKRQGADLAGKLKTSDGQVVAAQAQVKDLTTKLAAASTSLQGEQKKVQDLTGQLATATASLQGEQKKAGDLTERLTATSAQLATLQKQNAQLQTNHTVTVAQVASLQKQAADLTTKLKTADGNVAAGQAQVKDLTTKLAASSTSLQV